MKTENWERQHQAIKDLLAYLDETLPKITADKAPGSMFTAPAALYRFNRYLHAIDGAVSSGTDDTAGGNFASDVLYWQAT